MLAIYSILLSFMLIGTLAAITAQEPDTKQRIMILDKCKTEDMKNVYAQIFANFTSEEWKGVQCYNQPFEKMDTWNKIGFLTSTDNDNGVVGKIYGK